ncbi:hypothetical protein BaRGS_00006137 [Batillaria attramentaria]|uniref:Uncharacterized protein n=1 Tax=Batillaria attramentaria TaxID=370345 RepID=A0ABD0LSX4_9CAEN
MLVRYPVRALRRVRRVYMCAYSALELRSARCVSLAWSQGMGTDRTWKQERQTVASYYFRANLNLCTSRTESSKPLELPPCRKLATLSSHNTAPTHYSYGSVQIDPQPKVWYSEG